MICGSVSQRGSLGKVLDRLCKASHHFIEYFIECFSEALVDGLCGTRRGSRSGIVMAIRRRTKRLDPIFRRKHDGSPALVWNVSILFGPTRRLTNVYGFFLQSFDIQDQSARVAADVA